MWQGIWSVLFQISNEETAIILAKVGYFFIVFLPTTMYHFLILVSENKDEKEAQYLKWAYWVSCSFALCLVTDLFVSGVYHYSWGFYPKAGILHPLHVLQTSVVVSRGLYLVFKKYVKTKETVLRAKLTLVLIGLFVYFIAAVDYACNYGASFYPPGVIFVFYFP